MSELGISARTGNYGIRYLCLDVWDGVWVALDFAVFGYCMNLEFFI